MKKAFLSNLSLLLPLNLIVKLTYLFGIDRTVQNVVGTEAYGRYFTLFSLAMLLQIITDFGLAYYNSHKVAERPAMVEKYFPNLLLLKFFLALVYFVVVLGIGAALGYLPENLLMLSLLAFNQILLSFLLFFRSTLAALGAYRTDSLLSVLDKSLLVVFGALLLFGPFRPDFQLLWFVYAQTLSLLLAVVTVGYMLSRKMGGLRRGARKAFVLLMLKRSTPYALTVLLMALYTRSDVLMLERLLPEGGTEAGIYAGGYRLLDAANMMGFLMAGLLLPMFSGLLGRKEDIRPLFNLALRLVLIVSVAIGVTAFAFRGELVAWLYVAATPHWGMTLGWLMLTFIATSLSYVYGPLITAGNMIARFNRYYAYSIALNILLNLLLIFRFGAVGAAFATLLTQSFVLMVQARICGRHWPGLLVSGKWKHMLVFILLSVITAAAFHRWYSLSRPVAIGLSVAVQLTWAAALQLFSPRELMSLLKEKK